MFELGTTVNRDSFEERGANLATYYLRLRVGMSRLHVWRARGMSVRHFVPYHAEFAPEDKGG
jgi:hypothetical protein